MKKFIAFLLFPLFAAAGTNDGTILLMNDSPFILTATIQAADGTYLGQITLQPGQQRNFTQNLSTTPYKYPGAPDISMSPYTIIWQCSSDEFYSVCNGIGAGALVRANDCMGTRGCKPKKKMEQKEPPASTLQKKK